MRRIGQLTTDDALVHQVHPLIIGTNVAASAVSTILLWRRRPVAGLLVRYPPAMAASAAVLAFADLDRMRQTAAGRYAVSHMPDAAVAIRFAGDTLMAAGEDGVGGLGEWLAERRAVPPHRQVPGEPLQHMNLCSTYTEG